MPDKHVAPHIGSRSTPKRSVRLGAYCLALLTCVSAGCAMQQPAVMHAAVAPAAVAPPAVRPAPVAPPPAPVAPAPAPSPGPKTSNTPPAASPVTAPVPDHKPVPSSAPLPQLQLPDAPDDALIHYTAEGDCYVEAHDFQPDAPAQTGDAASADPVHVRCPDIPSNATITKDADGVHCTARWQAPCRNLKPDEVCTPEDVTMRLPCADIRSR